EVTIALVEIIVTPEDEGEADHGLLTLLREGAHPVADERAGEVGRGRDIGEIGETLGQGQADVVVGPADVAEVLDLGRGGEGEQDSEEQDSERGWSIHGNSFLPHRSTGETMESRGISVYLSIEAQNPGAFRHSA